MSQLSGKGHLETAAKPTPKRKPCCCGKCPLFALLTVHYLQVGALGAMLYFEPHFARVDVFSPDFKFQLGGNIFDVCAANLVYMILFTGSLLWLALCRRFSPNGASFVFCFCVFLLNACSFFFIAALASSQPELTNNVRRVHDLVFDDSFADGLQELFRHRADMRRKFAIAYANRTTRTVQNLLFFFVLASLALSPLSHIDSMWLHFCAVWSLTIGFWEEK